MKIINAQEIKNKNVIVRCDFNVPIIKNQTTNQTIELFKIKESLTTIRFLIKNQAKRIILISHLGRPTKKEAQLSLAPIAQTVSKMLKLNKPKKTKVNNFEAFELGKRVFLLENIRFLEGEEDNDPKLVQKLSDLGEVFIFDGFGVAHRETASTIGLGKALPTWAGFLMEKEIAALKKLQKSPSQPFGLILGGAKAEDKIPMIKSMCDKTQVFLIGGVPANTFLAAKKLRLGRSVVDRNVLHQSLNILESIIQDPVKDLFLPIDFLVSKSLKKPIKLRTVNRKKIEASDYVVDIGPKTIEMYLQKIKEMASLFWNGTLGIAEIPQFANSSQKISKAIISASAQAYVGGGDTTSFLEKEKLISSFDFVSTGGGAALAFLGNERMSILEILEASVE